MFPERDGEHVLSYNGVLSIVKWRSNAPFSMWVGARGLAHLPEHIGGNPEIIYITPILTPTQIAELLAGEREKCAQEAIHIGEILNGTELSPCNVARNIAHSIRNLGAAP